MTKQNKQFKIFNIEFDGIDKSGKDSIMHQVYSYSPNIYMTRSRGLISQLAYAKIFNRNIDYIFSNGYIDNTLFVLLTVDEDDWNIRCDLTGEHEKNKNKPTVESEVKWKLHSEVFEAVYEDLKKYNKSHFMKFNTSNVTPINIIKEVIHRIDHLNAL